MKKISSRASESRPEADKAKRVYRTAVETIRRLDEIGKQKKAYREVFMPDAINLRSRLQDYCERLMFYDPSEYGRKAEELLWRKVYYEVIQLMKHNRKQMRPSGSLESAFRTHLAAACGYYHHLLCKLQAEYQLSIEGLLDFYHLSDHRSYRKPHPGRKCDPDPKVKDWALKACHRCLVYLGDIARYQQDYDGMRSRVMSQRYYFQALAMFPNIGMPLNQLGTLAGNRCYNLDAAYHYMRCLITTTTFEGAHGNLMRLLEKNRRKHQDLNKISTRDLPPDQQRLKDIKRFVIRFMYLLDILHTKGLSFASKGIQEACQNALRDFELCLFYQPPHVAQPTERKHQFAMEEKLSYIEDEIILKIVVICIMSIYLLQKDVNKKVTAAIAFSLALFSHILNHAMIRLQSALSELENPRKVLKVDSADEKNTSATDQEDLTPPFARSTPSDTSVIEEDGKEAHSNPAVKANPEKRKQKLKKIRQRRRRRHDSDSSSESEQEALSDNSDLSEGGEMVDLSESDSENDEVLDYINRSDSSDSDSEDNLMVSQELKPGFCAVNKDQHAQSLNSVPELEEQPSEQVAGDRGQGHAEGPGMKTDGLAGIALSNSLNSSLLKDLQMLNADRQRSPSEQNNTPPHISDFLQELPVDALNNSSFLGNTLNFPTLLNNTKAEEKDVTESEIKDVVQGKKDVRVPPGFEKSEESQHVLEITEKIKDFVIETDTDTSALQTDTDYSTVTTESELDTETETEQESVVDKSEIEQRRLDQILKVIANEGLLWSIKIYCDWLRCNPHIIATCAKSSQSLWSRLSVLLNFLPLEADLNKIERCRSEGVLKMVTAAETREWTPTQPLKEDIHLQDFSPLQDTQSPLVFDVQKRLDLNQEQEGILRILYLRRFGHYISKMKSVNFTYDTEKSIFYGPLQLPSQNQDNKVNMEKMVDTEARRNQLMKDMAQLRLQAEVSQLEGTLQSHDQVNLPPYLVPDATALCETLNLVKNLANSARFIIIIPVVVIDHLDVLKKESSGARDCIRWLEAEIKKGNRYVRHQKGHEKVTTLPLKNLKKKDKDAWRFMQIVDCAKYLSQQSSDCDPRGMVCILTKHKVTSKDISLRLKQALYTAQQEGVSVQNAAEFHLKWKEVWQGGKS